jgi:hypothetical protein
VTVVGLNDIREVLMNLKETLLETCVEELREIIIGSVTDLESKETISDTDSEVCLDLVNTNKLTLLISVTFLPFDELDGG